MDLTNLYFHFTSDKLRDGTPIPPIGEWLIYPGKPIICEQGLHASKHPFDALTYAPGNLLHLVELSGIEMTENDKVVAKGRKIIATIDSTELLQNYARQCATDVLHLWDAPEIVKEFLRTGKNPDAAWAAARAAWDAGAAAWDAGDAAGAAAWAAARAARAAAWDAGDAARAAWDAGDAAWAAAWAAARAARAAARAAWDAMERKQRDYLLSEITKKFCK